MYELTLQAQELIRKIHAEYGSQLTMVIANGCCDGTAPYLYSLYLPSAESRKVYEDPMVIIYESVHIVHPPGVRYQIDMEENVTSDSLSLESDWNCRFILRQIQSQ